MIASDRNLSTSTHFTQESKEALRRISASKRMSMSEYIYQAVIARLIRDGAKELDNR